jgi:putative transposase
MRDRQLRVLIRASHEGSRRAYGSPRDPLPTDRNALLDQILAVKRRSPDAGLLHHSDQGCTYASEDCRTRLERHGIICSVSRRGNCYDNAVMESWFSTVKSEEGERFGSYAHAKEALFDYIEAFYNQRRRHSTLGQISPAEFERRSTHAA